MPLVLGEGFAGDVLAGLVDVDEAAVEHVLQGLLGLHSSRLLLFQLRVLLDEALQVLELVLDGLLSGKGLHLLLVDLGLGTSALGPYGKEVCAGATGFCRGGRKR